MIPIGPPADTNGISWSSNLFIQPDNSLKIKAHFFGISIAYNLQCTMRIFFMFSSCSEVGVVKKTTPTFYVDERG